jgi:hypothetical protein
MVQSLEKFQRVLERREVLLDLRNSLHQVANEVDECLDGRRSLFELRNTLVDVVSELSHLSYLDNPTK